MYGLTSLLGLCQQQTDFQNLGGTIRLLACHFAHFLVGFHNVGISGFIYQTHGLIRLTPLWVELLYVGLK